MSCSEPASGASARPPTHENSLSAHDSLAAVSLRLPGSNTLHIPHISFAVPVSHASHPTIIIQSRRARAVRARGGGGGARRPTRSRPDAGPEDIKTNSGVECDLCGVCPTTGGRAEFFLSFGEILIFRHHVCAAVVAVSDLCRIYRRNAQRS